MEGGKEKKVEKRMKHVNNNDKTQDEIIQQNHNNVNNNNNKIIHQWSEHFVRLVQGQFINFSKKVLYIVAMKQSLITTNAYISTLGGGFFLCRYLDHAKMMACKQYLIAKKLNEPILMSQISIHMAYNLIHEGSYINAYNIIIHQEQIADDLNHNELKAIVASAKHYLRKIKDVKQLKEIHVKRLTKNRHQELLNNENKIEYGKVTNDMSDNYQRHHVVKIVD